MSEKKIDSKTNHKIAKREILDKISEDDNLEELIYTIIDACPYDFESIPSIAAFKYLSFYDKITQSNEIRYFSKMYKLIDMLCFYKQQIKKIENLNQIKPCCQTFSSSKSLTSNQNTTEEDLFRSCQNSAIKIYKTFSFEEENKIDNKKLAFCLNAIINEFFEEAFTSNLSEMDIERVRE